MFLSVVSPYNIGNLIRNGATSEHKNEYAQYLNLSEFEFIFEFIFSYESAGRTKLQKHIFFISLPDKLQVLILT